MSRPARIFLLFLSLSACAGWMARAQVPASISGVVRDSETGETLVGASVVLMIPGEEALLRGVTTDGWGRYNMTSVAPGSYVLRAAFVGFEPEERSITLSEGLKVVADFSLVGGIGMSDVIVTASRKPEKVLDAPASVSVLDLREIQQSSSGLSSVSALKNTLGVDMARTGIDREEVVLRGFNNAFSGATYVLTDYRHAAVPSLGVNIYSIMPNAVLDLDRIEVVRGPGSALYGAGVDNGVIHFITKDPFTYPGTSVAVTGGERSLFGFEGRHAGVIGGRLGYKITGSYGQADDWPMDPSDPVDSLQLTRDRKARDYYYHKSNGNLNLQYRFSPTVFLTGNFGYSRIGGTVLSGVGTLQAKGFGYSYGQMRLQAGNLFSQIYVNLNDAGDSFLYGTALSVVDKSANYVWQTQYDLLVRPNRQRFVIGADVDVTDPFTRKTILGRNEDEVIALAGAYLQSTTSFSPQVDVTLAARGDYDNVSGEASFSPRAALVYKINPRHSLRATYNRAHSAPGTNSSFLDIIAGRIPGSGIRLRGRGSAEGFSYARNGDYLPLFGSDLVASSLNPAMLGADQPIGLPLGATYATVYAGIQLIPDAKLAATVTNALKLSAGSISAATAGQIKALLSPALTSVQGFTKGSLMLLNPTTGLTKPISGVEDVAPIKPTITQTAEVGYKGMVARRLMLGLDVYYTRKENFIGPLAVETPFVYVPTLAPDLSAALGAGIQNNEALAAALAKLGLKPADVAALIVGLAQETSIFPDKPGVKNDLPVAIVQPRENNAGAGSMPELLLSYRNFGQIEFFGVEAGAQLALTDRLDVFGNVSWTSDNYFDEDEVNETGSDLSVALNAPALKAKGGFYYAPQTGFTVGASGRYTEGFPVQSGPYVGTVEDYFLLDVSAGYGFARYFRGARIDVTVLNVTDNRHREFVGAPAMGRMGSVRLTYSM